MASDIRQLTPDAFPALLREIPDPPERLFVRGTLPSDEHKFLCIVGSRKYSSYGKEVCEKLVAGLAGYSVVIVSGLALGIDSIAHRVALDARLATIALPGSGLSWDVLYPRSHTNLAERILEAGGALVSEFPEDFQATPYSFPQRNRLMAGLSHAALVVEAGKQSGTLITARLATEYNRDVLTVPHSIFSHGSYGPHMLLRLGATPVVRSEDILEALGIAAEDDTATRDYGNLTEDEQRVVQLLGAPLPREELLEKLSMPIQQANILLSDMELKGLIKEQTGEVHLL